MQPLIQVENLWKYFGPNAALAGVNFDVRPGEVQVLAGANGAGKSTLVKILYGALEADEGQLRWKGRAVPALNITGALDLGVAYIPQEVHIAPQLTVAENIFLGNHPQRRRLFPRSLSTVNRAEMSGRARQLAEAIGLDSDLESPAGELSVAECQLVAIARALARKAELLLLDEPTAALSPTEIKRLFETVRRLKQGGSGIVFISHRLQEMAELGDRITVLRDGRVVYAGACRSVSGQELVAHMTGRPASTKARADFPGSSAQAGSTLPEALRVEELHIPGRVGPVSFTVRAGEVLGIAGVVGSGRTSLVRALFGAEPEAQGRIFVHGKRVHVASPAVAIAAGISLLTEDRKGQGLVHTADVASNISLAAGKQFVNRGMFNHRKETAVARGLIARLAIRAPSPRFPARLLSGGNQQKTLFARWLLTGARVFLLDEPTRGIDAESRQQVYALARELAEAGNAVVFISAELGELLEACSRILVLHRGNLCAERLAAQTTEHELLALAMGQSAGGA